MHRFIHMKKDKKVIEEQTYVWEEWGNKKYDS